MRAREYLRFGIMASAAVVACRFAPTQGVSDGGVADTEVVDVLPDGPSNCPGMYALCSSDNSTLITCPGMGLPSTSRSCTWGCSGTGSSSHCDALIPTGGAVTGSDFVANAQGSSFGTVVVDTVNGTIGGTTWTSFHSANGVGIFSFDTLTITDRVTFTGTNAVAFVANGDIVIDGVVDARGPICNTGGADKTAGPGGFNGAAASTSSAGSGSGGEAVDDSGGGGGGGFGAAGGLGGYHTDSTKAGVAGAAWGTSTIPMLAGGGGGGAATDGNGGDGGGGGGAIQFVSNTKISIGSASGIDVGGCGGKNPSGTHGGGGGGAGGAIVLEAPVLVISGQLAANGGGGGGGDLPSSLPGSAGGLGSAAAAGGAGHDTSLDENGGPGGAGTIFVGSQGAHGGSHGGGGGGAVGRIRLNSRAGSATTTLGTSATISPDPNTAGSPATIANAQIN